MTICPKKLEIFFMALFFFINNSCQIIGRFLSTYFICYLKIESHDHKKIDELIFSHVFIYFYFVFILFF